MTKVTIVTRLGKTFKHKRTAGGCQRTEFFLLGVIRLIGFNHWALPGTTVLNPNYLQTYEQIACEISVNNPETACLL